MDVYEAVTSRRSVRGFTDEPVPQEVLERVLSAAAWSPSGSNIQPWNTYLVTGARLAELKKRAVERVANGDPWDEREYEMYPPAMKSPYRERRSASARSATAHSALRARTLRPACGRPSPTGTASARPLRCSSTSIVTWARANGPTSGCICKPSCCCCAPKGCIAARRWRGRRFARRSRRSCHLQKG